ncbi:MAG: hypothetical protein K6T90_21130 [Leptolyngbyaceae cyanobacterium HOT.MB2.61]|jgi:hypothetical protein|nr:hypothetical protein [Leptolyngbyaceae cyanobacterium HOT.MB2.61]
MKLEIIISDRLRQLTLLTLQLPENLYEPLIRATSQVKLEKNLSRNGSPMLFSHL